MENRKQWIQLRKTVAGGLQGNRAATSGIAENLRRVTHNKKGRRTPHDILKVEYLEKIKNM